jgi:membrane-bound ClpP family serine protease
MSMWGSLLLLVHSKTSKIISLGLLLIFMVLIVMGIESFFGTNWLVCSVGGACYGIGGVLTFVVSLVRNWDKPILV